MDKQADRETLAEAIIAAYLAADYNQSRSTPLTRDLIDDDAGHMEYARAYADAVLASGWLADHDRRVREAGAREALLHAADLVGRDLANEVGGHTSTYSVRRWLRDRAAALGTGEEGA